MTGRIYWSAAFVPLTLLCLGSFSSPFSMLGPMHSVLINLECQTCLYLVLFLWLISVGFHKCCIDFSWSSPHRAVYVFLSLSVASIIYCFEDSDDHKMSLQEAIYREVILPLRRICTKLVCDTWMCWFKFCMLQDLIGGCNQKLEVVTKQHQVWLRVYPCALLEILEPDFSYYFRAWVEAGRDDRCVIFAIHASII